ncbi:MAG: MscL family protein [Candidatus Pacearchaeota archaeon]|jgi:large conductance mechanosensitive channel
MIEKGIVKGKGFIQEFKDFLKEYKIVGLAIAFIIGTAATVLIKSLVDDIVMPIVTFFIPGGAWKEATFALGSIVIKWGSFLGALINFIVIALVVFLMAKFILREEKVTKK